MTEDRPHVKHGVDDMTISINDASDNKQEDWHSDWRGKLVVDGKTYYVDLRDKSAQAPATAPAPAEPVEDDIPF